MAKLRGLTAKIEAERFEKALKNMGYVFFKNGNLNLNIIGVRNSSGRPDVFDDTINLVYKLNGEWAWDCYRVTTEPGPNILRNPIKSVQHKGTAILVPRQYRSTYKIGWHGSSKNGHTALCQRGGEVSVWRDNNRDVTPDTHGPEDKGWFGINIHKHRGAGARINTGGVSAGCQVFKDSIEFAEFMETCRDSEDIYGNSFTYTLIDEKDLI
tara:strand:- start:6251 stop:6883 length:633 start_codon:yes stop_codon:yes gene_type:complete